MGESSVKRLPLRHQIKEAIIERIVAGKLRSGDRLVEMKIADSTEEGFILTIENDGQEFEPQNKTLRGRGLSNIKSRANLIEARVSWQKREDGGMAFLLCKK